MPAGKLYALHINRRSTDVTVRPDIRWPGMWRMHKGGRVSDMVNLSRAKDAALSWLAQERGRGLGNTEIARWHVRELIRQSGAA
jgi:hypothetical protein